MCVIVCVCVCVCVCVRVCVCATKISNGLIKQKSIFSISKHGFIY